MPVPMNLRQDEIEVLELMKQGYSIKEVADAMSTSEKNIMNRLGNACTRNNLRGGNSIKVLLMLYEDKLEDR